MSDDFTFYLFISFVAVLLAMVAVYAYIIY
jgi:hypothetical protein